VFGATPVDHAHRFEYHVLEPLQPEAAGCGLVETSAAELPVATVHRTIVHDIVAERGLSAGVAGDGLHGHSLRVGWTTLGYEHGVVNRSATCLARRASLACRYIEVVADAGRPETRNV
jgi:hypothetical protein